MDKETPQKKIEPSNKQVDSYRTVGMHRLVGGWYYNMLAVLLGSIFFIAMFALILPLIMKYPEIEGYNKIVYGFLGFAFGFFDLGSTRGQDADVAGQLNDGILRFVGKYEHINPKKAFRYIQFFIWFQMFTGVVQIALISAIALWWLPFTSLAHLGWFFLAYSLIQFPGCLQIFESIFKGFQQIHLFTIYTFLKDTIIKYGTQIGCILLGSAWGKANPQIGEVIGATMGYIVSFWINMIVSFLLGAIIFKSKMKSYGFRVRDLFAVQFDKQIVKETLTFSIKLWFGTLAGQLSNFLVSLMYVIMIPNYGVYLGLISFARQLAALPSMQGVMTRNATPALAEAYANKKPGLFRFYTMNLLKYHGFISGYLLIPLLIFLPSVLESLIVIVPDLENYAPIVRMLPLLMISETMFSSTDSLSGQMYAALNKPLARVLLDLIQIPVKLLSVFLLTKLGFTWEVIVLEVSFQKAISVIVRFWYVQKKIIKLPWNSFGFYWQSYLVPLIIGVVTIPLLILIRAFVMVPLIQLEIPVISISVGIVIFLFSLFIYPIFIYTPLYAALGGFDEYGIDLFEKSTNISGPSKFITKPMLWFIKTISRRSKLYNRFPLPGIELAEQERLELNQLGFEKKN